MTEPVSGAQEGGAEDVAESGRGELRRAAFLNAAREVFLENGYEAANMAEIVRRAGGSLATLYAQFGGKRGLFQAVAEERITELTRQMGVELAAHAPLREGLSRIGESVLGKLASPVSLNMMRLMVGQARQFPDAATEYARTGPERVRRALADYLQDRVEAGEIAIANVDQASALFFDLLRSRMYFRALLDPTYVPSEAELREQVERAVHVFLNGARDL